MKPETKGQHTPTPWTVRGSKHHSSVIGADGEPVLAYPHYKSEIRENAAFIVRAVNTHHELIKQLKACYSEMRTDGWSEESLFEVHDIIDKAEGK